MADLVKAEDDIHIKDDPDEEIPTSTMDDFEYEDTGELDIPKSAIDAWLLRLPKQLYQNWATMSDDQPIELGHVRHFKNSDKFELYLNPGLPQSQGVPKTYELRTTGQNVRNTFTFSEKDLPGFKGKDKKMGAHGADQAGGNQGGINKHGRYQRFMRRAIPKQTTLAAAIVKEVNAIPNSLSVEPRQQRLDIEQGKGSMQILTGDPRKYARMILEPETGRLLRPAANFDNFKMDNTPAKAKSQENKTARMPQNELLDKLYECFTKYKYWTMTAFRQALQQPESYIRQTLPLIADQVKSGQFNNHWTLKPEANTQNLVLANHDVSAPQAEGDADGDGVSSAVDSDDDDNDDDDNDEDLQMEDVNL